MKNLIIFFLLVVSSSLNAQENFTTDQSFLIIQSTRSYDAALRKAQAACNKLGIPLNLNGNYADKEKGLSNSSVCGCGEKHGYIPRGRGDSGDYVSIEYSSAFATFSKDYYIVVVASGNRSDVAQSLPKVKKVYEDAYIKDAPVYMGCMH